MLFEKGKEDSPEVLKAREELFEVMASSHPEDVFQVLTSEVYRVVQGEFLTLCDLEGIPYASQAFQATEQIPLKHLKGKLYIFGLRAQVRVLSPYTSEAVTCVHNAIDKLRDIPPTDYTSLAKDVTRLLQKVGSLLFELQNRIARQASKLRIIDVEPQFNDPTIPNCLHLEGELRKASAARL